jgi:uncharacterized membrane protein YesL
MLRFTDDFWEQIDYWASFILVNLLWVLCALPLITLPAATAGLFAVTARMSQGLAPNVFSTFFEAMHAHWKTSTGLMLINLSVAILIALNLSIFPLMSASNPMMILARSVTLFIALLLVMVNGYAWPLMVTREISLKPLLMLAVQMVFAHPFYSLGLCLALIVPLGISAFLPMASFVLLTFSCTAFATNWVVGRVLKPAIVS